MDSSFTSFFSPMIEMDNHLDGSKQLPNDQRSSFVDSILSHTPMVNPPPFVTASGASTDMNQQQMMAMMMNFFLTQMGQPTVNNNAAPLPVPPVAPSSIIVSDAAKKPMNNSSMTELELDGVSPISSDSFSSDEYSSPSSPQSMQYCTPTIDYRTTNPSLFSAINPNTNNNNITNTTYSAPSEQYSLGAVAPSSLLLPQSNDKKKGTKGSSPTPAVKEESEMSTNDKPLKSRTKKTTTNKRGQKRSAVESDSEYDSCNDSDDENNSSSSSSSLPPSLQDLLTEVDEKKRRLARKAELARMSRRRKKMRLHDLEKEVDRLNKELSALKKHAKGIELEKAQATAAVNDEETEYKKLMSLMNEFVSAAKSNNNGTNFNLCSSTEPLLDNFVASHTQFINNGQHHLNALSYHVAPILPFEFLNWMCTQNEKFYEESAGLWKALLVDELKLNDDQMTDMDTLRHTIRKQFKHVAEIEKQFKRLNDAMTKQNIFAIQNLERIRAVLTPAQFAHYIDWVQKFGAICLKISV